MLNRYTVKSRIEGSNPLRLRHLYYKSLFQRTYLAYRRDRPTNRPIFRVQCLNKLVSAVLTAPAFLSGLSDVELGVIRQKVEKRVLSAEVAEAKATTEKALLAAEKGWARAVDVIAQRGGLQPSKGQGCMTKV